MTAETKDLDDRDIRDAGCQCHALRSTHLLVFSLPITSIWVLKCLLYHLCSTLHNHQVGSIIFALTQDPFSEAVPLDKLYFPKGVMFYRCELYS